MALFDALAFLADVIGPFFDGLIAPWHYLLSVCYRRRKHRQWGEAPLRGAAEFIGGTCGLALGLGIAWFCTRLLMQ